MTEETSKNPLLNQTQNQTQNLTESLIQDQEPHSQPGCFHRYIGSKISGPTSGVIFALLACGMGTGIFNLPYRIADVGILAFLIFLIVTAACSYLGMVLLWKMIDKCQVESFSDMSQKAYGPKFRKITQFCLILYPWGITVCYQVIFTEFIMQLLTDNFGVPFYDGDIGRQNGTFTTLGFWVRVGMIVLAIAINLALVLQENIEFLHKISKIGVFSVIFNTFVVVITFIIGFTLTIQDKDQQIITQYEYRGITGINWDGLIWFKADSGGAVLQLIQTFSSLVFCFVSHQLVFPLIKNMTAPTDRPTDRQVNKIFLTVHTTEVITYFFVGLAGYLLLAEHVNLFPINAMAMASIQTVPMSVGKLLTAIALYFSIPLNLIPTRNVIYTTFSLEKTKKTHILISLLLALSGTIIAITFRKVNSYFGLLGGTAGMMICGAILMVCYRKLIGIKTVKDKLLVVFMTVTSILGMLGAILSVVYAS